MAKTKPSTDNQTGDQVPTRKDWSRLRHAIIDKFDITLSSGNRRGPMECWLIERLLGNISMATGLTWEGWWCYPRDSAICAIRYQEMQVIVKMSPYVAAAHSEARHMPCIAWSAEIILRHQKNKPYDYYMCGNLPKELEFIYE